MKSNGNAKPTEIVVVSGKGGTGKTSLTGALARLFTGKIIADCDVDAANLHLILMPLRIVEENEFTGGKKAAIDPGICTGCGRCREVCRFGAITENFSVDDISCEGCGACYFLCPVHAVEFTPRVAGSVYVCDTEPKGSFVYAELFPGEENSGKLVASVRERAKILAEQDGVDYVLIDGPPGIGCPVISSITGTDMAIIVTEPTPSGFHDLGRILALVRHFGATPALVVNRYDINRNFMKTIWDYCTSEKVPFLGAIPYDTNITEAQREGKSILEYAPDCDASRAIRSIYEKLTLLLEETKNG